MSGYFYQGGEASFLVYERMGFDIGNIRYPSPRLVPDTKRSLLETTSPKVNVSLPSSKTPSRSPNSSTNGKNKLDLMECYKIGGSFLDIDCVGTKNHEHCWFRLSKILKLYEPLNILIYLWFRILSPVSADSFSAGLSWHCTLQSSITNKISQSAFRLSRNR